MSKHKILLVGIAMVLTIMPFFWFRHGEMDLGGDGGRLYFYDPVNLIKNLGPYYVFPSRTGMAEAYFFYLPFIGALAFFKQIISSSYVLISIHNAIKIVVGFLAVYAIIKELIGRNTSKVYIIEIASILAGLFYLSTPAMLGNYVKAIPSHSQVFLNPLMFYLILRFFLTSSMKYIWVALMVSLIFANNFSFSAAPPFFAFYPLAMLFIFIYCVFIRKVSIPWKKLLLAFLFFLGIHAFHLVPEFIDAFTAGSNVSDRLSGKDISSQLDYFYAVLRIPSVSFHLLAYFLEKKLAVLAIIIPLIIVLGLLFNRRREKTILLAAAFFLLTLFFATAKITNVTVKLYEWLFYIPGFTMFRNFYGQWQFAFSFFYSILFGLAVFSILQKIKFKIFSKIIFLILAGYFTISSWQFINGSLVNPFREEAVNIKGAIIMDPDYEATLAFIRSLRDDGKILILPFTDSYAQVIHGLNKEGAYVGSATIGQLTGKKDFAGYVDVAPYSEIFWELSKNKDYESIKRVLGLLNIRYIYYNSDIRIYDTTFPARPYSPNYVRKYMPSNQEEYKEFVKNLTGKKIFERSFYNLYKIEDKFYLPHFYTASKIFSYKDDPDVVSYGKASLFFQKNTDSERLAYIENDSCNALFSEKTCIEGFSLNIKNLPKVQFTKINPTKYKLKVSNAKDPYILIFSELFHGNWKLFVSTKKIQKEKTVVSYFDGKIQEGRHKNIFLDKDTFETLDLKPLKQDKHFVANGYANGWYISPQDTGGKQEYELIAEMTGQRAFYISLFLSIVTFGLLLFLGIKFFLLNSKKKNNISKTK